MKRIVVIDGHPDPDPARLCHAVADTYAQGAAQAGAQVVLVRLAELDFDLLVSKAAYEDGILPPGLHSAWNALEQSDHMVLVFPLWLGYMPARLKALLEQLLRPGFAYRLPAESVPAERRLAGKSARLIVTMGMPSLVFRCYFAAHGVRSVSRSILRFCGVSPVRVTLLGGVEARDGRQVRWLRRVHRLGSHLR